MCPLLAPKLFVARLTRTNRFFGHFFLLYRYRGWSSMAGKLVRVTERQSASRSSSRGTGTGWRLVRHCPRRLSSLLAVQCLFEWLSLCGFLLNPSLLIRVGLFPGGRRYCGGAALPVFLLQTPRRSYRR